MPRRLSRKSGNRTCNKVDLWRLSQHRNRSQCQAEEERGGVNAQQRRRMKRIRQRQRESAERRLSRGDRQFVTAHAPPPKRVCVMTREQSVRFQDVSIGHRCTAVDHRHYTRKHVDKLKSEGMLEWVGIHYKIAAWIKEVHWEGRDGAMQLLPGSYSKRGADQDVQRMPHLSGFVGGRPVAMLNDGRIE